MIEIALVLPLFFILIFGCVQFAMVFFVYSNTVYATQVAVRYACTHDNLVITPHTAGATVESIAGARIFMANRLAGYLRKSV